MDNFIPSAVGTLCAELATLPICTIKTVYQNSTQTTKPSDVVLQIYRNHAGVRGFFQASVPAVLSQVISTASKYHFYHMFKSIRQTNAEDLVSNSLNGMAGGLLGSVLTHPIDVWKNHIQRGQRFPWQKGMRIWYQGYTGSIAKNIVLYSCLFPIYDYYKLRIEHQAIAAVATTLTCSLLVQPVDYYKTVLMAGNRFTGYMNPYRGFTMMVSRSVPHFMITTYVTETVKQSMESIKVYIDNNNMD
jgi:hypothetical protein